MIDVSTLALPIHQMMGEALHTHLHQHKGLMPKKFVLHPEILRLIKQQYSFNQLCPFNFDITSAEFFFEGVKVDTDILADCPKLISCNNEVVYL